MSKVNSDYSTVNPFLIRFKPDYRYRSDKKIEYKLRSTTGGFVSHDDSITDKEAFAINFASERGDMSSLGASREGVYSIPAGKPYDPNNDFSYLNRPDITLVDLDNYIEAFKERLENADNALKSSLENELKNLQSKKNELSSELDNGQSTSEKD